MNTCTVYAVVKMLSAQRTQYALNDSISIGFQKFHVNGLIGTDNNTS